jgi:Tol biopolymer transport system component
LSGELNKESQLFMVDSHGTFLRTLITTKNSVGNAFCNRENQLAYYSDESSEPTILSSSITGSVPRRVISLPRQLPVVYAPDGRQAAFVLGEVGHSVATVVNLETQKPVREFSLANHIQGSIPHFSAGGKALGFIQQSKDGFAIVLQPLDGSPGRRLTSWFKNSITDFGFSPSGKFLAIGSDRSTSDVALITDKSAKRSD